MKGITKYTLIVMGITGLACFLFFLYAYPYHLLHREQTLLFTYSTQQLYGYLDKPAVLSCLTGDFLSQFFYSKSIGAAIIALLMTSLYLSVYVAFRKWMDDRMALPAALLIFIWETGRFCDITYPLSGTVSLMGGIMLFLLADRLKGKWAFTTGCIIGIVPAYWLFGYGMFVFLLFTLTALLTYKKSPLGSAIISMEALAFPFLLADTYFLTPHQAYTYPSTLLWGKPNFGNERILGLNTEDNKGNWKKVNELAQPDMRMGSTSVSYNLANGMQGQLAERLMNYYQPAGLGLFMPVTEEATYLSTQLSGEVWFHLGDMTMAEHAAILSMIFSPQHKGTRMVKRLAEINLINGDKAAALKYLHLLSQTFAYKQWARERMPGKETPEVKKWLKQKRALLPHRDTIRLSSTDVAKSLHLLLEANPDNFMARDYLLCFHLLMKDLPEFVKDYRTFYHEKPNRLYAEALLIHLYKERASGNEIKKAGIPPGIVQKFNEYNHMHKQYQGKPTVLESKFGKTYWFYYMYAQFESAN